MTWLPDWGNAEAAGWFTAGSILLTFCILWAMGVIQSGRTTDMWRSAYEKLREADDIRRAGLDEVQAAKDDTIIHLLEAIQQRPRTEVDDDPKD